MDWPRADGRLASLTAQQRAGVDAGASGGRPEAPGWCSAPAWQVDFGCGHPCPVSLLTPRKVSLREPAAFAFRTQVGVPAKVEIYGRRQPPDRRAQGAPAATPRAGTAQRCAAAAPGPPAPPLRREPSAAREADEADAAPAAERRRAPGGAAAGGAAAPSVPRGRGGGAPAPWLGPEPDGEAVVALGPELAAAGAMACGAHAGGPKRPRGPLPGARAAGSLGGAVGGEIVGYLSCLSCLHHAQPGASMGASPGEDAAAGRSAGPVGCLSPYWAAARPRGGGGGAAEAGPWPGERRSPAAEPVRAGGAADVPGAGLRATEPAGPGGREGLDPVPPDPIEPPKSEASGKKKASLGCWLGRQMAALRSGAGPGEVSLFFDADSEDWMIEGFTDCCSLFWGGRWAGEAAAPTQGGGPGLVDARGLPPEERSLREWIKPKQRDPFCRWVRAALAEPGAAAAPAPPRAFGEPLALRPPSLRHGRLQLVASVALPPPAGRGQRPGAAVRLLFEDIALRQIRRLPEGSRPGGRGRAQ